MPQVTYYVAASLDGFIADENGGVSFLDSVNVEGEDYGYHDFYDTVDGLVMGRATYDMAISLGPWHYEGKPCWVCTHNSIVQADITIATSVDQVMREAIQLEHLWLVGGGDLAAQFLERGAVDRMILSTVPVTLGNGIPLFTAVPGGVKMQVVDHRDYDGGLLQQTFAVTR